MALIARDAISHWSDWTVRRMQTNFNIQVHHEHPWGIFLRDHELSHSLVHQTLVSCLQPVKKGEGGKGPEGRFS